LLVSILEGRNQGGGQMPPNQGMVSEELARELVALVRKFAPEPPPARTEEPPTLPRTSESPTKDSSDSAPPRTSKAPTKDSSDSARPYTLTGNFEVDFNHYAKEFDNLQRRVEKLVLTAKTTSPADRPSKSKPPLIVKSNPPLIVPPDHRLVTELPAKTDFPAKPAESGPEKSQVAVVPVSDRPFTPDDVARGEELFLGRQPLANGGQACIACHAVNHGEAREGGRIGPQLTKAYERLGGRTALSARLWAPATPTMRPAYRQHALEPDEVLALAAYLEDVNKHAVEAASPLPLKFALLGLGGAVLGLAAFGSFWGSHSRREQAPLNGKVAAERPASQPKETPSPVDCLGAGL
jgi:mono/diheme cytochrome c family protein